jgi:hypothetical protein
MLAGQVGIITTKPGWYGRAIQLVTASPAYHVITAINETHCVSAETPTVRIRRIDYFTDVTWTNIELDDEQRRHAIHFVCQQVGKPYAYTDIVFLLIASITKRATPAWIIERLSSRDQWFCSELADAGMIAAVSGIHNAGINMFPGRPECTVTPADFYTWATSDAEANR